MRSSALKVLVVDDDQVDTMLTTRCLEAIDEWDIRIVVAGTLAEALAELPRSRPDVILLDHYLGAETGLTFLKAMKDASHSAPVIFLTGRGDEELAVEAMKAGVMDYMGKSALTVNSLRRALHNAVEKSELQKLVLTHRKNIEEKNSALADRNREIESFYHTVSHELKTPLTSMREFISLVLDEVAGTVTDDQREYLSIALDSCCQMTRCINDMLDLTRLETGKLRVSTKPVEIGTLVRRLVRAAEPTAQQQGVKLSARIAPDLPTVEVDEDRIAQVIRNLLDNALKFTRQDDNIVVSIAPDKRQRGYVRASVRDSGRGIPREQLSRIFDRLYQVKDDEIRPQAGLGLGLSICKQLVELHGGVLDVASSFGKGSTFSFTVRTSSTPPNLSEELPAPEVERGVPELALR